MGLNHKEKDSILSSNELTDNNSRPRESYHLQWLTIRLSVWRVKSLLHTSAGYHWLPWLEGERGSSMLIDFDEVLWENSALAFSLRSDAVVCESTSLFVLAMLGFSVKNLSSEPSHKVKDQRELNLPL